MLKPLKDEKHLDLPFFSSHSIHNAHLFYVVCSSSAQRNLMMNYLAQFDIPTASHYSNLHSSPFYKSKYKGEPLVNADKYADSLLRLPLHYYLNEEDIEFITDKIKSFFEQK